MDDRERRTVCDEPETRLERRDLLRCAAGSATAVLATSLVGCASPAPAGEATGDAVDPIALGPLPPDARADAAFRVRLVAAKQERNLPIAPHPTNGDEERYKSKFAITFTRFDGTRMTI